MASGKRALDLGNTIRRDKTAQSVGAPQRGASGDRIALTVRLDQATYERLVIFAARRRQKHQGVLEEALLAHLDANGG